MELSQGDFREALMRRVSQESYEKLRAARVGIAGLGGLGSHIAVSLARCGIGSLHLVDFDRVDMSNLNRQHYFISHLGRFKTEALADQLWQINPSLKLTCDNVVVTAGNATDIFAHDPLVCEAFDRPESKALLVNVLLEHDARVRVVASSGMAGTGPANDIRTRRLGSRLYICGDEMSAVADDEPLFAPRVALCAGHQAQQIIRLVLEEE
ncbi:MAG: sulfur carrier protein ThiS adenylyltransferase ThiF [Raoultibacter sp.]